jgi:hypothetical protein
MESQLGWLSINSNQEKTMDSTVQTTTPEAAEKEDINVYELWMHDNQVDHMEEFLEDSNGDITAALRLYAEFMRSRAEHLDKLAEAVDRELSGGAFIDIHINPEYIDFSGDEAALDRIAEKKLIECY